MKKIHSNDLISVVPRQEQVETSACKLWRVAIPVSITVESRDSRPRRLAGGGGLGASRNLYGKRGEIDLAFITEMIYAGRPRYATPPGHVGVHEASQPRSSAFFSHANPPVLRAIALVRGKWRAACWITWPLLLSSFYFPSFSLSLRVFRSWFELEIFEEDALPAIYETLYCRRGVVLLGFLGDSIGEQGCTIVERAGGF